MYDKILKQTAHRSSSLPNGAWMMSQKWENLLFMHFPVSKQALQSYLPDGMVMDCYQGDAWVTILPFEVSDMHFRKTPSIPYLHTYLELNVRTYVKKNGIPGLYFFSLDANKLLTVLGARMTTLPYYYARMDMWREGNTIHYRSKRWGRSKASLQASFLPYSSPYLPKQESIDKWLLERYYAWKTNRKCTVEIGIHHMPWEIQEVEANIQTYQLTPFNFENLGKGRVVFHFSPVKRVLFWPMRILK
ncbi:hypothetical protein SAMN05192559_108146 [Halobacillus karajensis]|uniref:YqjF family protein n=1 Tax=Halobacillus karajensis TaxID=195088 RepID=UPI0008A80D23|nr:DUF2071 domain-containing protein [Halobacillus karajensis]SEI05225.1 hypothetical protein SAMN05192559_108146 [Halobacillus karajensis]